MLSKAKADYYSSRLLTVYLINLLTRHAPFHIEGTPSKTCRERQTLQALPVFQQCLSPHLTHDEWPLFSMGHLHLVFSTASTIKHPGYS